MPAVRCTSSDSEARKTERARRGVTMSAFLFRSAVRLASHGSHLPAFASSDWNEFGPPRGANR